MGEVKQKSKKELGKRKIIFCHLLLFMLVVKKKILLVEKFFIILIKLSCRAIKNKCINRKMKKYILILGEWCSGSILASGARGPEFNSWFSFKRYFLVTNIIDIFLFPNFFVSLLPSIFSLVLMPPNENEHIYKRINISPPFFKK